MEINTLLLEKFLILMEGRDIPGLQCLIQTARKQHLSWKAIFDQIHICAAGDYSAFNYSRTEGMLMVLAYQYGGPALVYTLHKALALPSLSTTQELLKDSQLTLSIGAINSHEILSNIHAFFGQGKTSSE